MKLRMHTRTKSALPIATVAALLVAALLLSAALPAMAQAQDETPTPEAQNQEPAPTPTPTASPTPEPPTPTPEPPTPTPEPPTPTPEPPTPTPTAELPTPTPEPQNQESASDDDDQAAVTCGSADSPPSCDAITKTEDDSADAQSQGPAATLEETPTPDAQNQESAPTPTPEPPTPTPTASPTPTPEAQNQEQAADQGATKTTRPELTFKQSAWSADETDADGTLAITVNINPALTEASAVNIATSPNPAGDARVPSTLALPAGQTSVDLPITIIGDDDAEEDESFDIELSATDAAPYALGAPAKTTITIIDDDRTAAVTCGSADSPPSCDAITKTEDDRPELTFKQSVWSADETDADGTLAITVNINPALAQASAVNILTHHNGAASAADVSAPTTLALPAGQTSVDLSVTIIGDDDAEEDESFDIELSATDAAPYTLGEPAKTTITIIDDDRTAALTCGSADSPPSCDAITKIDDNSADAQSQGPAATPTPEPPTPTPTASPTPTPEAQGQESAPAQKVTPTPETQNQESAPASEQSETETVRPELTFKQSAWTADETDADSALTITVNINPALTAASAVNIATSPNPAGDAIVPTTLALPAGQISVELSITIIGDEDDEEDESFDIELSATDAAPYTVGDPARTTITINDDDTRPTLTFTATDYTVYEPRDPGDWATYNIARVQIAPALQITSTVSVTTRYDTATAADASASATLTLPAGATSVPFSTITVLGDDLVEGDESFEIELVAVADAPYTLGEQSKTTITIDDRDLPTLSFAQAGYVGSEESGKLDVTVNISPAMPIAQTVPVDLKWIKPSGATPDTTNLTLPAGATSATMTFNVNDDAEIEGAESYEIELTVARLFPSYRVGQPNRAAITIEDNDFVTLSLGQAAYSVSEADSALDVNVNISPALTEASAVNITTRYNGAASAADVSVPATLTLPKGATSATLQINITSDTDIEGAEKFDIELVALQDAPYELGAPATATITINDDGPALASINDDDSPALAFSQASYTVNEADGVLRVVVNLSSALPGDEFPQLSTVFGEGHTATSADIGSPIVQTKVQAPDGISSVAVEIPIIDDDLVEGSESFSIALTATAAYRLVAPAATTITIVDDEKPILSFAQAAYTVNEADGELRVVVNLSSALPGDEFPQLRTVFGEDHTATSADIGSPIVQTKVQAPDGNSSIVVKIPIANDADIEGDENFKIELVAGADAPYELGAPATATVTIDDDDLTTLTLEQAAYTVYETAGALDITVNISPVLTAASAVNITTRYDSASAADAVVPATLTLPQGATSATLRIPVTADDLDESAETLTITLSAVEDAPYELGAQTTATITINDDNRPTLAFAQAAYSVNEDDDFLVVTVNISPPLPIGSEIWLTPDFGNGHTATLSDINDAMPVVVTLASEFRSLSIPIRIANDSEREVDETFAFTLKGGANTVYRLGSPATATVTIVDNDRPILSFPQSSYIVSEKETLDLVLNVSAPTKSAQTIPSVTILWTRSGTTNSASYTRDYTLAEGATSASSPIMYRMPDYNNHVTYNISLTASEGALYDIGEQSTATVTVYDRDRPPQLTLTNSVYSVDESDVDGVLNISVNIFPPLTSDSTVNITTRFDTAAAADVSAPATLTLPKDATSVTFPITVRGDDAIEGAESFDIALSAVADASYELGTPATATVTINDDDRATVSLGNLAGTTDETAGQRLYLGEADYTVYETAGALSIPVHINPALPVTSTVNITTSFDSASAADVSVPATLTLPQGATSATLRIPITADTDSEGSETFTIALSAVADAPYELNQPATATITINDDNRPTLAFEHAAYSLNEADGSVWVTVKISRALSAGSTLNFAPVYSTATAADVTLPASQWLGPGTIGYSFAVPITDDDLVEGVESFQIALTASAGASFRLVEPATATVTIIDDETPTLAFAQAAYTVSEADGALDVAFNISRALPAESSVSVALVFDTATAADAALEAEVQGLGKNLIGGTFPVLITNDALVEGVESFKIVLTASAGASYRLVEPATTTVTIVDDDFATLAFSQAAYTATEADSDGTLNLTVNINPALPTASAVTITTRYDSATADDVSVPATLTLPAGQTSVELPITISGDDVIEGDESFEIELVAAEDALYTLGDPGKATITINDDDQPSPDASALSRSAWTITVTPGDQRLDVSWQPPPAVNASDISKYWVAWCLEDEELGCSPTSRSVRPAADGSGSYTIAEHFSSRSEPTMVPLINGARYRVYVYARQADFTLLATSEFSYDNRPQAPGDNPEN